MPTMDLSVGIEGMRANPEEPPGDSVHEEAPADRDDAAAGPEHPGRAAETETGDDQEQHAQEAGDEAGETGGATNRADLLAVRQPAFVDGVHAHVPGFSRATPAISQACEPNPARMAATKPHTAQWRWKTSRATTAARATTSATVVRPIVIIRRRRCSSMFICQTDRCRASPGRAPQPQCEKASR